MDLSICGNKADFLDRYKGQVAINVKYHGVPKLSDVTLVKLKELDGATRDNVVRFAEEALRESWWASMQERSRDLGLGDLWSDGRSGGWLVFQMSVAKLEELFQETERSCRHCSLAYDEHLEGKCPFDASSFQPEDPRHLETFEAFRTFSAEVKDSLQHAGDTLEEEILFQLENLDDYVPDGLPPTGGSETNPPAFQDEQDEEAGT